MSQRNPLPHLAPKHTLQGCIIGDKTMAIFVNLTDLGMDLCHPVPSHRLQFVNKDVQTSFV